MFASFLLASAFAAATTMLGTFHVGLLLRGQTTYEDGDSEPNPFDLGRRANVAAVAGPWWGFCVPWTTTPGDGHAYARAPGPKKAD